MGIEISSIGTGWRALASAEHEETPLPRGHRMRFCPQHSWWDRLSHMCPLWQGHLLLDPEQETQAHVLLDALHFVIVIESSRKTSILSAVIKPGQTALALGTTFQCLDFQSFWSLTLLTIPNRF